MCNAVLFSVFSSVFKSFLKNLKMYQEGKPYMSFYALYNFLLYNMIYHSNSKLSYRYLKLFS